MSAASASSSTSTGSSISCLSLEEKISQLGDIAPAIPLLSIPGYKWWSEALHGVSDAGRSIHYNGSISNTTSYPQVILIAASFNPLLWYRIGEEVSTISSIEAGDENIMLNPCFEDGFNN